MSDLMYASIVIVVIWTGIFLWVFRLDRRLRNLEKTLTGNSRNAEPLPSESADEAPITAEYEIIEDDKPGL